MGQLQGLTHTGTSRRIPLSFHYSWTTNCLKEKTWTSTVSPFSLSTTQWCLLLTPQLLQSTTTLLALSPPGMPPKRTINYHWSWCHHHLFALWPPSQIRLCPNLPLQLFIILNDYQSPNSSIEPIIKNVVVNLWHMWPWLPRCLSWWDGVLWMWSRSFAPILQIEAPHHLPLDLTDHPRSAMKRRRH